ncbi:hypothetical protein [Pigmentiphaga sp. D-2]|uniref:hypothetical protein n=1 Tax=Pigmentiphaga sp. D-2 TaxID=1002116 RepID=UPI0014044EC8|nr:hypothetical protein [Pigmentiphaga sp. D-2]
MTDLYSIVLMQTNRVGIDHRRDIRKANLDRIIEIFGYGPTRLAFREYAPLKLVVLPEVFMQGWNNNPEPYSNLFTKVAKDMAIRIPGDEIELLAEQARKYKTYRLRQRPHPAGHPPPPAGGQVSRRGPRWLSVCALSPGKPWRRCIRWRSWPWPGSCCPVRDGCRRG